MNSLLKFVALITLLAVLCVSFASCSIFDEVTTSNKNNDTSTETTQPDKNNDTSAETTLSDEINDTSSETTPSDEINDTSSETTPSDENDDAFTLKSFYPMTMNTYDMLYNFRLGYLYGSPSDLSDTDGKLDQSNDRISLIASFSYEDLAVREGSVKSSESYINELPFMDGYRLNSTSVSKALENIYTMEFLECKKANPSDGDLKKYGLDKDVYFLTFDYDPQIANGGSPEENWVNIVIWIGQRTKNGTYFVYSTLYNMVVEVDQYYLSFLDWDESDWYSDNFFQTHIGYVKNMNITVGGQSYDFTLNNQFSYAYYDNGDGTGKIVDLTKGKLTQTSGGYVYTVTKTGKEHRVYLMDFSAGRTYRDASTGKIMYKGEGDSGDILVQVTFGSSNLQISCSQYQGANGALMDYVITVNEDSGYTGTTKPKTYTAVDNFRRLYAKMLYLSIIGDADEVDFDVDPEMEFDEYLAQYVQEGTPVASISYSLEDMASILNPEHFDANNQREAVIRFYEYPDAERKYLITIETPNSKGEQGRFYVSAPAVEDLGEYLNDLMNQVLLPSTV